jgi:hypothetical protein
MAYQVLVRRLSGQTIATDVIREATPLFGSTMSLPLGDGSISVQLVSVRQRTQLRGDLIDYVVANEL